MATVAKDVAKSGSREFNESMYTRRVWINRIMLALAVGLTLFTFFWLVWIIGMTLLKGVGGLSVTLFTENTPPPGVEGGGMINAFYGSILMIILATLIGTPTGILAGTYLAEYARGTKIGDGIRFVNDILISAPSIVVGLFIYMVLVKPMGHFSGWAGAVALAVILLPVVVRTTDEMLQLVPGALREAALALGAPYWKAITLVIYRSAMTGIMTGVLLAVARISGETAPLLFTALNNQYFTFDPNKPMANVPVVIFQYAMSPYDRWQELAWAGAFMMAILVLLVSLVARLIMQRGEAQK